MRTLRKSLIREIWETKTRFISIVILILIATLAFTGLLATSPDMTATASKYLKNQNNADVSITSLSTIDSEELNKLNDISEIEYGYKHYGTLNNGDIIIIHNPFKSISKFEIIEGKLPTVSNQIALQESYAKRNNIKLNDEITLKTDPLINSTKFKVTALIKSPLYIIEEMIGRNFEGNKIDTFAVISEENFNYPETNYALINYTQKYEYFTKDYEDYIIKKEAELPKGNYAEIYHKSLNYTLLKESTEGLTILGIVFPGFLFFIAGLVVLTTIKRMVEEERIEIGTLKSLGYNNGKIRSKYIVYSLLACLIGSTLGIIIGHNLLPTVIFDAYNNLFSFTTYEIKIYIIPSLIALIIGLISTVLVSTIVSDKLLKLKTSELLRGEAPKNGSKILLERIKFIWKRLSFKTKITLRNLFRYKSRMLMTIIGVAGSSALLLMGLGLRNSLSVFDNLQYGEIDKYNIQAIYIPESDMTNYNNILKEYSAYSFNLQTVRLIINEPIISEAEVTMYVVDDAKELMNSVNLNDYKTKLPILLNGITISEKISFKYKLNIGDILNVKKDNGEEYKLEIKNIIEEYSSNKIYIPKKEYEKIFNTKYIPNTSLITVDKNIEKLDKKLNDEPIILSTFKTSDLSQEIDNVLGSMNTIFIILISISALLTVVVLYTLSSVNIKERYRELSTIKVLGFYDSEATNYIYRETFLLTIIGILVGFIPGKILHTFISYEMPPGQILFPSNIGLLNYIITFIFIMIVSLLVMLIMHQIIKKINMVEALKSVD